MTSYSQHMQSPLGELYINASDNGLTYVGFDTSFAQPQNPNQHTQKCVQQLEQYFANERKHFELAFDVTGTVFQKQVWQALSTIEFGQSCSYGDIAKQLANPKAVRAVGAANGKNPISIIVPCHRVIGKDGTLTGYAGGLERKKWLLEFEGISKSD